MPALTADLVEDAARVDPDRTLATSFLDNDARARVIALILFNHELARARSVVSDAGLAAIRLQWWRDTIDQIFDGKTVRAQPVAIALAGAIGEASLPRAVFVDMIEGYEAELDPTPFQTWTDLEHYLDQTQGNLNRLSLLASGLSSVSTSLDTAAREAGIAWGLTYVLRETPKWFARRCVFLPLEALFGHDHESLFAGEVSERLQSSLRGVLPRISHARRACNQALRGASIGQGFPVLACASLSSRYAKAALPKVGPNWHVPSLPSLLTRQVALTLSVARQRV